MQENQPKFRMPGGDFFFVYFVQKRPTHTRRKYSSKYSTDFLNK